MHSLAGNQSPVTLLKLSPTSAPGPLFITQHPSVAYGIYAAYLLAHPIMVLIYALSVRFFMRVVAVNKPILIPAVLVLCAMNESRDHQPRKNGISSTI